MKRARSRQRAACPVSRTPCEISFGLRISVRIRPMGNNEKHSHEGLPKVESEFDLELTFSLAEWLRVFFLAR